MTTEHVWIAVGLLGQALFSARMILQWLASERRRRSVVPKAFWYFSIGGGLALLFYAIYRRDPVFIIGQGAGLFVYARNVYFIHKRNEPVLESP
ncbi:MAG TPA: lipid-A-disaccharide synthase N-terminal domain-containing protein [Terriglobales bacterium]|nr:lipid-A-disaccharide synthase N-terminal domain-containing protein [Terriglobales bacterium]